MGYHAQLCDWGVSMFTKDTEKESVTNGDLVGSLLWAAPELLHKPRMYSRASDVYALTMILYECVTLQAPFVDDNGDRTISLRQQLEGVCPKASAEAMTEFGIPLGLLEQGWGFAHSDRQSPPSPSNRCSAEELLMQVQRGVSPDVKIPTSNCLFPQTSVAYQPLVEQQGIQSTLSPRGHNRVLKGTAV